MDIALGDDACEWCGEPQVGLHVTNRSKGLAGGFDTLLCRDHLAPSRFGRLLGDGHVVSRHHAGCGGCGFQFFEGSLIGRGPCAHHRQLGFGRLQLRLRFCALRRELGGVEGCAQRPRTYPRAPVHSERFHECRHPRIDRDRLMCGELAWQRQLYAQRLLDNARSVDRDGTRSCCRRVGCRRRSLPPVTGRHSTAARAVVMK
jgi:hypothetical protein